jgi:EmrB/QacA subfamily drug resistance transporter
MSASTAPNLTKGAGADDSQYSRRWLILAILGLAQLMVVLDSTIVNIALPTAQGDLGFSNSDRQWIVTAYALAFGSLLLIGGRLADFFGRKRVLLVGLVGFAAASAIGGASVDFTMLVSARAVQGAFGALLAPAVLALLTTTFTDPAERGKAFGIFGGIAGAGASIGLLLGGFLTEYAHWRWTMYVNLVFAAIAFVGASTLMKDAEERDRRRADIPGTITITAGLFALVYGFSNAEQNGWHSPVTIICLIAAVVLLVAFVVIEFRVPNPILPMRIVLDRNRGGAYFAMFLSAIGIFAVFLFLTYYLQQSLGYSAVKSGLAFLPMTISIVIVASLGSAVLVTKISSKILIPVGMTLGAIGLYLLTHITVAGDYATAVLPGTIVLGVGLGLVFAPGFSLATLGVSAEDSGVASATVNTMQQIGGSVGTALFNTLAASAASSYAAAHIGTQSKTLLAANASLHSYTTAFWLASGVFIVGAVVVAFVLRPGIPQMPAFPGAATDGDTDADRTTTDAAAVV